MAVNIEEKIFPFCNPKSTSSCITISEKLAVNNQPTNSQTYSDIGRSEVLQIVPKSIHFQGFKQGSRYCQILRVINASQECQRVHILPPICNEFSIKYKNKHTLFPGMCLKILIEFKPKEKNFLQDRVSINCKDVSDLSVPIYAYFYLDLTSSFPTRITFKPTVVGKSDMKKVPLQNTTPVDLDFQVRFIEKHVSISASPLEGVVPANDLVYITMKYSPLEFCTAVSRFQILISQFNSQPHVCTLVGSCQPGLAAKLKEKEYELNPIATLDPLVVSPLGRLRVKKLVSSFIAKQNEEKKKEIEVDGVRFPLNLNNTAAVNYVLMQKPSQTKGSVHIRGDKLDNADTVSCSLSKQMKEELFEEIVNKNVSEEQKNHIGWHVHLGEMFVSETYKQEVINQRSQELIKTGCNNVRQDFKRNITEKLFEKTCRPANLKLDLEPSFSLYKSNEWGKRHIFLQKFIQAARKIIVQYRLLKNLKSLSSHLPLLRQGKFTSIQSKTNREETLTKAVTKFFECHFMKPQTFNFIDEYKYVGEPEPSLLGLIDVKPIQVLLTSKTELYNLEVPQQYKLLSYTEVSYNRSVAKHVPKCLPRKLKTGLEHIETNSVDVKEVKNILQPLVAPEYFNESSQYHSMHIFNPLPGIQAQPQPLAYSEIDDDYSLCPVNISVQYKVNEKNMIPEIMHWKRFPSQGLVAMQDVPIAKNCKPQLTDPFINELLFSSVMPPLLESLPQDDVMEECSELESFDFPTMDSVKSNFKTSHWFQGEEMKECNDTSPDFVSQQCSISVSREKTHGCDDRKPDLYKKMEANLFNIQQSWNLSKTFHDRMYNFS